MKPAGWGLVTGALIGIPALGLIGDLAWFDREYAFYWAWGIFAGAVLMLALALIPKVGEFEKTTEHHLEK